MILDSRCSRKREHPLIITVHGKSSNQKRKRLTSLEPLEKTPPDSNRLFKRR